MNRHTLSISVLSAALLLSGQLMAQSPDARTGASPVAAPDAMAADAAPTVTIVSPQDGDTVSSPVRVVFGIQGMSLAPVGTFKPGTGHHHLLIDTRPGDAGVPIPASEHSLHFGKAQSETTIELPPGRHTLQLLLGDGNHVPHDPPVISERITITVE